MVFYAVAGLSAASSGLVYLRGGRYMGLSVGACVLILAVLIINERMGFAKTKQARRPYEARHQFNRSEITILFLLLILGIFLSVTAWLG